MARTKEPIVCRLPVADRAQRTADFPGLLADGLVEAVCAAPGGMAIIMYTPRG